MPGEAQVPPNPSDVLPPGDNQPTRKSSVPDVSHPEADSPVPPPADKLRPPSGASTQPTGGLPNQDLPPLIELPGVNQPAAPGGPVGILNPSNQPGGSDNYNGPPQQLPPPPPPSNPFPDWGHNPPVEVQPTPVPVGDGPFPGGNPGGPCGSSGPSGPCNPGSPGNPGGPCDDNSLLGSCNHGGSPPPPILGDNGVYNPWQHGNRHYPPPDPDIFVGPGQNDQVVIVNNVTNINNTVINNVPADLYLTNFLTHQVLTFPVNYGTPYALGPNWCGGIGGSWGWSASIGVPFFGASFAGGGAFNVGSNCGYVPPPPVIQPLYIYGDGYSPWYTNDYFVPQGCGCVYANNTYMYGDYQPVVIEGQTQQAFVPTSYTPDIVFQQPTEGLPPFITGDNPVNMASSQSWFKRQPAIMWVGIGVVVIGLLGLAYVNRQRLLSVFQ